MCVEGDHASIVDIRCETDFTARSDIFRDAVTIIARILIFETAGPIAKPPENVQIRLEELHAITGENFRFARGEHLQGGSFGSYVHTDRKRAAVVQFDGVVAQEIGDGIAIHVVGVHPTPVAIAASDVPTSTLDEIRIETTSEVRKQGNPEHIAQKIAEGRVAKYLKENTLLDQVYVKDPAGQQIVKNLLPKSVTVKKFVRYVVGG